MEQAPSLAPQSQLSIDYHASLRAPGMEQDSSSRATAKACDACRRRKLRCRRDISESLSDPRCIRCVRTGLRCTYNDERRPRGPKTGSRLRELRASQAIDSGEQSFLPSPSRPSPPEITGWEEEMSEAGERRDQSTDPVTYEFSGDYLDKVDLEQAHGAETIPHDFGLDQLLFVTPDTVPFDLEPAAPVSALKESELSVTSAAIAHGNSIDFSKDAIVAQVSQCFSAVYQRYPLWHLDTLVGKIEREECATDNEFRSTCLSIYLLNESSLFRKNPHHGSTRLLRLTEELETTRAHSNSNHFADCPSTASVIVSLVLFIAHSVTDRHNLAFYYLNEAAGLLRLVDIDALDSLERALYRRLEAILFVTESASMPVYGKLRKNRMVPCPENLGALESSMRWYTEQQRPTCTLPAALSDIHLGSLDNKAVNLLHALVCLYNATTADEISKVSVPSPAVSEIIEQGVLGSTSLQAADVDITRQWQLCLRWRDVLSARKSKSCSRSTPGAAYTLQIMGLTVLQYSRALRPGECRLVGHGKWASLATAIHDISSNLGILASCSSVIGDLIRTVCETDYEGFFAPQLSLVQLCIETVPRQLTFGGQDALVIDERQ